jgi:hypothetical protein
MKLSIKKSCFIHDFISTLDDGASTSAKKIWPLHSSMGGSHATRCDLSFLLFDFVSMAREGCNLNSLRRAGDKANTTANRHYSNGS